MFQFAFINHSVKNLTKSVNQKTLHLLKCKLFCPTIDLLEFLTLHFSAQRLTRIEFILS